MPPDTDTSLDVFQIPPWLVSGASQSYSYWSNFGEYEPGQLPRATLLVKSSVKTCRQPVRLPTGIAWPDGLPPAAGIVRVTEDDGPVPAALVAATESRYVDPGRNRFKVALRADAPAVPLQGPVPSESVPSRP